jgi:hypothetical protein
MSVMTIPHATMMVGSQIDGRSFLSKRFDGTSKKAYVKKNTVRHLNLSLAYRNKTAMGLRRAYQLYCAPVMLRSSVNPSIFALPMFPRSKKDSRYNRANIGMRRKSIFRSIFFSSRWAKDAIVTPGLVANASIRSFSSAFDFPWPKDVMEALRSL